MSRRSRRPASSIRRRRRLSLRSRFDSGGRQAAAEPDARRDGRGSRRQRRQRRARHPAGRRQRRADDHDIRTDSGRLQIVRRLDRHRAGRRRGRPRRVRIDLVGEGAFVVADGKQIPPPLATASATFTIQVPADAVPGSVLLLHGDGDRSVRQRQSAGLAGAHCHRAARRDVPTSTDLAPREPGSRSPAVRACAERRPASRLRDRPAIVTTTPFVTIAAGSDRRDHFDQRRRRRDRVHQRADRRRPARKRDGRDPGGIVSGIVRDSQLVPVANARITLDLGLVDVHHETDADGRYRLPGVFGPFVTIKVLKDVDATTRLLGFGSGAMNRANGFVNVDVVLIAAGDHPRSALPADGRRRSPRECVWTCSRPRLDADQHDVHEQRVVRIPTGRRSASTPSRSSDSNGNRGRAPAEIASSGQDVDRPSRSSGAAA